MRCITRIHGIKCIARIHWISNKSISTKGYVVQGWLGECVWNVEG